MRPAQMTGSIESTQTFSKRQIQWLLLLRVLVLSLLLGLSVLLGAKEREELFVPPLHYIAYFIASMYAFTISSALMLRQVKKDFHRFTFLQILTDVLLTTTLVFYTGISQSVFIFIYFFPIISAGLMLTRKHSMFIAAICTFCYGGLLFMEYKGIVPNSSTFYHKQLLTSYIMVMHRFSASLTFFLAAILSSFLAERLQKTEAALSQTVISLDRISFLYKQIFDDINTGIITVDRKGVITSFNRAAGVITGYLSEETIGIPIVKFFPGLELITYRAMRPVIELTRRDGVQIPIGYSWARLNMQGGNGDSLVYTFQDLSQIKKMEDQVRQAEKMASIGLMAAGIAHEFRNPLASISGSAQMLSLETNEPSNQKLLQIIIRECDRLEQSIEEFLQFSKPARPDKQWFSISLLVHDAVNIMEKTPQWKSEISVHQDISDYLDCWADQNQLRQVLLNLMTNSLAAMTSGKGEIIVRSYEGMDKNNVEVIIIEILDTGPGIPPHLIPSIFEPFFTTREKGTGLGLAIVWQIVESHEGSINFKNRPEGGASFKITLPLPTMPGHA